MIQLANIRAGIIGLYTTFELLNKGIDPASITIIAEFFPGDQSFHYASPNAGAYFTPFVDKIKFCRYTYESYDSLRKFIGEELTGIEKTHTIEHFAETIDQSEVQDILNFIPDITISQLPSPGCSTKASYTGITFNPPLLTLNLLEAFRKMGVNTVVKRLSKLDEAFLKGTTAVFNCSGLGAAELVGDKKIFPTRGQVVVICDPRIQSVVTEWKQESSTYIIPRPHSKAHEVILGGFYQHHVATPHTLISETQDIIDRTLRLCPELLHHKSIDDLQLLRVVAAVRPSREGGARIEKEITPRGSIFHNYGAGGLGYLNGLGMAKHCVELYLSDT